jgi:alkylation response protein AidB-like acyl-CoA dehydrogenase
MQFRLDDDQLAMRDAVRAFCADHFDLASIASREGRETDVAAWQGLVDLGVLAMLDDVGLVEATIVFEELGAHLASGPVLWSTLAGSAGKVTGVEVVDDLPLVIAHAAESEALLVLRGDRLVRTAVPAGEEGAPLDPLTPVRVVTSVPDGEVVGEGEQVRALRRHGTVLAAAMLVGAAQGALDVAREYALEREQFERPIGSFQAVKHLLADMYVRVELARASTYAAAAIASGRGAGDPDLASASAKLLAGEAGIANGRAAVQVLGGMGFTWEMLPHYFLKRSFVLDDAFGTSSCHALRLGAAVAVR